MAGFKLTWAGALALLASTATVYPVVTGCGSEEEEPKSSSSCDEEEEDCDAQGEEEDPTPSKTKDKDAGPAKDSGPKNSGKDAAPAPAPEPTSDAGKGPATPDKTASDSVWCQAKALIKEECLGCHNGSGAGGSPKDIDFGKYADLQKSNADFKNEKVWKRIGVRIHPETSGLKPMPATPLKDEGKAIIDAWVKAGAPGSDTESCEATSGENTDKTQGPFDWEGKCDQVVEIRVPGHTVPASPEESYEKFYFDAPWGDEEVQVINTEPISDNLPVLHHWILYDAAGPFLTGWAPGDDERTEMPADVGMKMPKGKRSMYLDLHYYNRTGTSQKDSSGVKLCVVKGKNLRPNPSGVTMGFSQLFFTIPVGATAHPVKATCTVRASKPVTLMTASPHAHKLAVRTIFSVTKKDGTKINMLDEKFQFGEQESFTLKEKVTLETGDKVHTECQFKNDTSAPVGFGESNDDEMCFNFASYYPVGGFCCEEPGIFQPCTGAGFTGSLSGLDPTAIFGGGRP